MMIRRSGALVALIAALSLAGCAGDTAATEGASGAGAPAVPSSGTPSASVPSTEPTTGSPGGKGSPGGPVASGTQTITGTVAAGVEPGCLLLTGSSGSHLLIIRDDKVRTAAAVGSSVTVVGRSQPDMMTTCQQGTPFLVSEVRAG